MQIRNENNAKPRRHRHPQAAIMEPGIVNTLKQINQL